MAKAFDIGVTANRHLGGGLLTGKYNTSETASEAKRLNSPDNGKISDRDLNIAGEVSKIAAEIGKPASQVSLYYTDCWFPQTLATPGKSCLFGV
jgi:aryl-alcohol dehydrogenase-like predicted oxidoreductase